MKSCGKKYSLNLKRFFKKSIAMGINEMTEREILDTVYRQIVLAQEQNLTDKAPEHFKQLKVFIEEERQKTLDGGGGYL
jgi:hypothetical protein